MRSRLRSWAPAIALGALCVLVLTPIVQANTPQPQYHMGRVWLNPEFDGAEGWGSMINYPGGINTPGATANIRRDWVAHAQKRGTYLFSLDWADPEGITHPYASSYFFRSMNYDFPPAWIPGTQMAAFAYLYGGNAQQTYRWARPEVVISTAAGESSISFHPGSDSVTILPDHGGVGQYNGPAVDANLIVPYTLEMWWTYIQGVRLMRTMYGYPYGSAHQDYVLEDMTFTNEGKSNRQNHDGTPLEVSTAVDIANNNLNKVIWAQAFDFRNKNSSTASQQNQDTEGSYIEPWGAGKNTVVLLWDGDDEGLDGSNPGPDYGDPAEVEDYQNHLVGNAYNIMGPVFVSKGPGGDYAVPLADQPSFRTMNFERGLDFAGKDYSPASPQDQREYLADGISHMPVDEDYRDYSLTADVAVSGSGPTAVLGYGPISGTITPGTLTDSKLHGWDLAPGEAVRIVQVFGAGGIDQEEARRIGAAWNTAKAASAAEATWMSAADQALVQTGIDTAMKAAALAYWNFYGELPANVSFVQLNKWGITNLVSAKPAAYNQPFNVPDPPRPPGKIHVGPKDGHGIMVRFTTEAEGDVDFDTKVGDMVGYRIYRQSESRVAPWEMIADVRPDHLAAIDADTTAPAGRFYRDSDITPGKDYWYAVTAYDDGSQNWARPGVSLESARWWTWTGYSHIGVTAPQNPGPPTSVGDAVPGAFALSQNVPNPFNPTTTISFTVPTAGQISLSIYSPTGQLVRTLVDGSVDSGQHSIVWDGTDLTGRPAASGVYVYRLTGDQRTITKRMVLVK